MITKMKKFEYECHKYAERWNKNWEHYSLVISAWMNGYKKAKEISNEIEKELIEVDVRYHQAQVNYQEGLLNYDNVIRSFFKEFGSEDVRIHEDANGLISVQGTMRRKKSNLTNINS